MEINEYSEDTVAGPTDKDEDSDAEMACATEIDDDYDDNDDHADVPSPSNEQQIVVAFDIPYEPSVTQEAETRMVEGGLVENLDVSLSEGC